MDESSEKRLRQQVVDAVKMVDALPPDKRAELVRSGFLAPQGMTEAKRPPTQSAAQTSLPVKPPPAPTGSVAPRRTSPRTATAIRLPDALHERLCIAASERDVSLNFLVTKAVEQFLDRLIPVEEMRWTRDV